MKKLLATLAVLAGAALVVSLNVSRPLFDDRLDPAALDDVAIAPIDDALTFARYRAADGSLHLLLVTEFRGGRVTGLDLQEEGNVHEVDPIRLFRAFGYDHIAETAKVGAQPASVDAASLEVPFTGHEHNIGVGANYREHARESGVGEAPFLFPKRAAPTHFAGDVIRGGARLLDYEAELGLVLLNDLAPGNAAPAHVGLVLANELTDRWALVRGYDSDRPMGTTGFADGKSGPGYAPVGPLLLIPRDFESFYRRVELRLYLNGRLRQRERAGNMTWPPAQILRQVFEKADLPYAYQGGEISLVPPGTGWLPAGTVVFSGTPAGVIFRPLNLWNPWVYLRPGDEVVVSADFLGSIRNRVR